MTETAVPPAAAGLRAEVDRLLGRDFASLAPPEPTGLVTELETQRVRLAAVETQVIAALAAQVTPADSGATWTSRRAAR